MNQVYTAKLKSTHKVWRMIGLLCAMYQIPGNDILCHMAGLYLSQKSSKHFALTCHLCWFPCLNMVKEVLLACVGKPSAGKSSFLNAGTFNLTCPLWIRNNNYSPWPCSVRCNCQSRYGKWSRLYISNAIVSAHTTRVRQLSLYDNQAESRC